VGSIAVFIYIYNARFEINILFTKQAIEDQLVTWVQRIQKKETIWQERDKKEGRFCPTQQNLTVKNYSERANTFAVYVCTRFIYK
jgi:hypothetical protein